MDKVVFLKSGIDVADYCINAVLAGTVTVDASLANAVQAFVEGNAVLDAVKGASSTSEGTTSTPTTYSLKPEYADYACSLAFAGKSLIEKAILNGVVKVIVTKAEAENAEPTYSVSYGLTDKYAELTGADVTISVLGDSVVLASFAASASAEDGGEG